LAHLPPTLKLLITLGLIIFGFVHIFAIFEVYLQTKINYKSVQEYFSYMPLAHLIGISHAHFFGHATMYALMIIPFVFCSVREGLKAVVISAVSLSAFFDVLSWTGMKYVTEKFEYLSILCGSIVGVAYLFITGVVFYELWIKQERRMI